MVTLLLQDGVQLSSNAESLARSGWVAIRRSASLPILIPTIHMMKHPREGSAGGWREKVRGMTNPKALCALFAGAAMGVLAMNPAQAQESQDTTTQEEPIVMAGVTGNAVTDVITCDITPKKPKPPEMLRPQQQPRKNIETAKRLRMMQSCRVCRNELRKQKDESRTQRSKARLPENKVPSSRRPLMPLNSECSIQQMGW